MGELIGMVLAIQGVLVYIALYAIALMLAEKQGREVPFVFIAALVFSPLVVIINLWVAGTPSASEKDVLAYRDRMLDRGIDLDAIEEAEDELRRMDEIESD
jgi:hypothetical protein